MAFQKHDGVVLIFLLLTGCITIHELPGAEEELPGEAAPFVPERAVREDTLEQNVVLEEEETIITQEGQQYLDFFIH